MKKGLYLNLEITMFKSLFGIVIPILALLVVLGGCVTPLPPTYEKQDKNPVLEGPIRALAGEGDLVAAVNGDGLFIKKGEGPWVSQEVPGITEWDEVTCLAVSGDAIYVGSDGQGLHILSDGSWEVRTSRYDGLPDDGVLSIAVDRREKGGPGEDIWVGTRKGVAAFRDGQWYNYTPDKDWLVAMTGKSEKGAGRVYLGSGFKLGRRGEDSSQFQPPVTAIGIGVDRLVLGNGDSRIAVITENGLAVLNLLEDHTINRLVVEKSVIWAGTDKGLVWGGLRGEAEGEPWPTHLASISWRATLFGSRDSRPFEYFWKRLGYNSAPVVSLLDVGADLWVVYRSDEPVRVERSHINPKLSEITDVEDANPITAVRRFVNIGEYIVRKEAPHYETYGLSAGIKGDPTAVYVSPDGGRIWIGTKKGLWALKEY